MTGERKPGHAGGEDDGAAAMAMMIAQRGWPAEFARQAAEGAEEAGYPEEGAFWARVAAEVDAIEARKQLRVVELPESSGYRK